ncbi:hypothetical protein GCM10020218_027940 [Dactylosporangium vinaceum]
MPAPDSCVDVDASFMRPSQTATFMPTPAPSMVRSVCPASTDTVAAVAAAAAADGTTRAVRPVAASSTAPVSAGSLRIVPPIRVICLETFGNRDR